MGCLLTLIAIIVAFFAIGAALLAASAAMIVFGLMVLAFVTKLLYVLLLPMVNDDAYLALGLALFIVIGVGACIRYSMKNN